LHPDFQRINKTGTGGLDVKGGRISGSDLALHEAGGRWERHVGRQRRHDDQIDLIRFDSAISSHAPPLWWQGRK